jgi:hypothetical protein
MYRTILLSSIALTLFAGCRVPYEGSDDFDTDSLAYDDAAFLGNASGDETVPAH